MSGGLGCGGEEEELAPRCNPGLCGGDGGGHVINRSKGYDVELAVEWHGFDPVRPDFNVGQGEGAHDLAEEGGFFVLGFGEGDLDLGVQERDGQAGESGSGAEVEEGFGFGGDVAGGEEAFAEMAADDLFGIADSGEVGAGVPF